MLPFVMRVILSVFVVVMVETWGIPGARGQQFMGVVGGVVVDAGGNPLAGISVDVLRSGAVFVSGRTDAHGQFRLASLPTGVYSLKAYAPGLSA